MKIEEYILASMIFIAIYVMHYSIGNWSSISKQLDTQITEQENVHVFLKIKMRESNLSL